MQCNATLDLSNINRVQFNAVQIGGTGRKASIIGSLITRDRTGQNRTRLHQTRQRKSDRASEWREIEKEGERRDRIRRAAGPKKP